MKAFRRASTSVVLNSNSQAPVPGKRVSYLKLIPYEDARKRIVSALSSSSILPTMRVSVDVAQGRVCAEEIRSNKDLPNRYLSAMDGYALDASTTSLGSTSKPLHFVLEGSLFPGSRRSLHLEKGHTCYVATGAPLPAGANAVARVEEVRLEDKASVIVTRPIEKGKNVFHPGEDYRKGDLFFERHRILSAADVALLMSLGKKTVRVFRKPKVGILSIGDELRAFGSKESKAKTMNNYFHLIRGFISELNIGADSIGICPDNPDSISELVTRALRTHDMIITIGGSSVGAKDFTVSAVSRLPKATFVFHGIMIVPIRPTGLFIAAGKPVVVLPANAISVGASFFLVALPVLNLISGLPFEARRIQIRASSETSFENEKPLPALYLVILNKTKGGGTYTFKSLDWGSNLAYNLSRSNGFVLLERNQKIAKNQELEVSLFGAGEMARLPCSAKTGK